MLQSHKYLLDHLNKSHDIVITEEEFLRLLEAQHKTSIEWKSRLANEPDAVYYDINNGKVLGIIGAVVGAVAGIFLAPVIGVGVVTAALVGAAIGWRLFGGGSKKNNERISSDESRSRGTQSFGFNSVPIITPVGGPIPLIFTNKSINGNGGVRTSGNVLNSRVETDNGIQRLYVLYGLCLGEIGDINESELFINRQPRNTFLPHEVVTRTSRGTDAQGFPIYFPSYSQAISVSSNNLFGITKKGTHIGGTGLTGTLHLNEDDFYQFLPTDVYANNRFEEFQIISSNPTNNTINISSVVTMENNSDIYALYRITYRTTKSCTEIHLNFVVTLWARDDNNDLQEHGLLFSINVDKTYIGTFLISNKSENQVRHRVIIRNLPLAKHEIFCYPIIENIFNTVRPYVLRNNAALQFINTGISIGGRQAFVAVETSNEVITGDELNDLITLNKKQTSNDRGPIASLTTVNEYVHPTDIGHPNVSNYKGIALGELVIIASNKLQNDPAPSWLITQGIRGRRHIASGVANTLSDNFALSDFTASFRNDGLVARSNYIIRNLDKGIQSYIDNVARNDLIYSVEALFWEPGERYIIYQHHQPLVYFPDIYVWTITSKRGGLGELLRSEQLGDFFIDYDSIIRSKKFCIALRYFWDGVIDETISWAQWASQESMGSLLFPTRIGGKFGLIPEEQSTPVMLFNASNIIKDTYTEDYAPRQSINTVHINYTDNSDDYPVEKTITVMTSDVNNGTSVSFPESLNFPSITNPHQAIRVAQVYLKSRLLQDRAVSFSTALQGYTLREGDLIIVQHITTEVNDESSGFVLHAEPMIGNSQTITLSAPSSINLSADYSAAVYRLRENELQVDLNVTGQYSPTEGVNVLTINNLDRELKGPGEDYTGDYVIVGQNVTFRRTYRVQKIEPQDDGTVSVTAVLWSPDILNVNDLVTIQ